MKKALLPLCLFLCFHAKLSVAQVSVAPTSLFIDDQNRFETFLVHNNSGQAQEIELEFLFGYPATDEHGATTMRYDDEEAEEKYSAAEWIRAFPRVFILEPGARQTVRFTVRPPAGLSDGLYWTRIKTTSTPAGADIQQEVQDGVSAQISFRVEQVTAGFYRKGSVHTGLSIDGKNIRINGGNAVFTTEVTRTGNAPFLGGMQLRVMDDSGSEIYSAQQNTTIYLDAVRKMEFDISDWPAGSYTAELTFKTERPDIPSRDIAHSAPVTAAADFTIN